VARLAAILSHYKSPHLNATGFNVLLVDAIIADEGIGKDENLPSIGRISEHLLIPSHRGVKYHLTIGRSFSAKRVTFINRTVFQD
jgi:hypothetical protein